MEEESSVEESWSRIRVGGIMEEQSWRRSHGGAIMEENHGGAIIEKSSGEHLGGIWGSFGKA